MYIFEYIHIHMSIYIGIYIGIYQTVAIYSQSLQKQAQWKMTRKVAALDSNE